MKEDAFDRWFPRIMRVLSGVLGLVIFGYETVVANADRPWLLAFALALLGAPLSEGAARFLGRFQLPEPSSPATPDSGEHQQQADPPPRRRTSQSKERTK